MAQLTITVPDPAVARVRVAMGKILGLQRDATVDEVRQFIVDTLTEYVQRQEIADARQAAKDAATDLGATL